MKIVLAHYKYHIQGGPERYMFKFMQLAKENGAEVIPFSMNFDVNEKTEYSKYFVSSDGSKTGKYEPGNHNIRYLIKGAKREFHNKEAYKKMCQLIENEHPDVLYVLIPGQLTADIFKAAKKYNVPIILRLSDYRLICGNFLLMRNDEICEKCIHGNYKFMVKNKCVKNSKILSMLRKASLNYARKHKTYSLVDAVITPPKFTSEKMIESGYFPKEKMYVNPTFLNVKNIVPSYTHKNYVLCLGRFAPEKGFIYVIKSLEFLKDIDIKIAITGDKQNASQELLGLIEKLDVEDKIIYTGFVKGKELEELIKNSMTVACPATWYENLPNVVIESYAYGKPVIASRIGSLTEIVEDNVTGLLFENKNSQEIANCIRKMYDSPDLVRIMGENARKKSEKDFSPEKHWITFMNIFNSIKRN